MMAKSKIVPIRISSVTSKCRQQSLEKTLNTFVHECSNKRIIVYLILFYNKTRLPEVITAKNG